MVAIINIPVKPAAKTLKRSMGKRNIWKPDSNKKVSFPPSTKRYNGKTSHFIKEHQKIKNRLNYNQTSKYYKSMVNSRKSVPKYISPFRNPGLSKNESKILANITHEHNTYKDMMNAVNTHPTLNNTRKNAFARRLRFLYQSSANMNPHNILLNNDSNNDSNND
jgi:hypothetical protein